MLKEMNTKFKLSQRALLFLGIFLYALVGITYFSSSLRISALDSTYFCVVTVLTIGYGDITPETDEQRLFDIFFIIVGVGVIGSIVSTIGESMLAAQDRFRTKLILYLTELLNLVLGVLYPDRIPTSNETLADTAIVSIFEETVEGIRRRKVADFDKLLDMHYIKILLDYLIILLTYIVGASCMMSIEGWSPLDAFYWSIVTISTVGFGDIYPVTDSGKVFTIFFALFGCIFMAKGLTSITQYSAMRRSKEKELAMLATICPTPCSEVLRNWGQGGDGFMTKVRNLRKVTDQYNKSEGVLQLLRSMGKVDDKDILLLANVFSNLDSHDSGVLTEETLVAEIGKARARDRDAREAMDVAFQRMTEDAAKRKRGISGAMQGVGQTLSVVGTFVMDLIAPEEDVASSTPQNPLRGTAVSNPVLVQLEMNSADDLELVSLPHNVP